LNKRCFFRQEEISFLKARSLFQREDIYFQDKMYILMSGNIFSILRPQLTYLAAATYVSCGRNFRILRPQLTRQNANMNLKTRYIFQDQELHFEGRKYFLKARSLFQCEEIYFEDEMYISMSGNMFSIYLVQGIRPCPDQMTSLFGAQHCRWNTANG
jgi:hypothetical protein